MQADRTASHPETKPQHWSRLCLPALGLALGCFAAGAQIGRDPGLHANPVSSNDLDQDGLTDLLELVLGTDPISADTDSDGFGDLEELARQSDPLTTTSQLGVDPISTNVVGRASNGVLHAHVPVYVQGGNFAGVDLELGFSIAGVQTELPPNVYLAASTITLHPGHVPGDLIVMLDIAIPQSFIESVGSMALYALTTPVGASSPTVASAMNVFPSSGILLAVLPADGGQGFGGGGGGSTVETVYRPLNGGGEMPLDYSEGQICSQTSSTVGSVGVMLQQQVDEATCEDADAFCASDCPLTVGEVIEILDPLALIGG